MKLTDNQSDDEAGFFDETEAESPNWQKIFEADFLELFERKLSQLFIWSLPRNHNKKPFLTMTKYCSRSRF